MSTSRFVSSALTLALLAGTSAAQKAYAFGFRAADAAFDTLRGHVYLTRLVEKELVKVDPLTGQILQRWRLPYVAEAVCITPDMSHLYVALPSQGHNCCNDDHEGYIAEVDLALGAVTRVFWINEDPWDLVATDSGFLVVSSGSGQWDDIRSYDLDTGANVSTASFFYYHSNLALHPSQTRIYVADTGLSPSDIERIDIDPVTGALTPRGDSIYHGDHPMDGDVYPHPNGDLLITQGGGVYTSNADRTQDMLYLRTLDFGFAEAAAFDTANAGLLTASASSIDYYNLESLESVDRVPLSSVDHMGVFGSYLCLVDRTPSQTRITSIPCPSSLSAGNTAPAAAFTTGNDPLRPGQTIKFDASLSADAQDRLDQLQFRWDFTGDGVFDTPFGQDPLTLRSYSVAGTKTVTLEVKDSFGLVDRVVQSIHIPVVSQASLPFVARDLFELQLPAADVAFDPRRPYVYASSRERRCVLRVNRWTGLEDRRWSFDYPAESLALTSDGRWLYVALLTQGGHLYYGFDEHHGAIAEIDLALGLVTRVFPINEDPFDIVVTDAGFLVVSSGSGQWDQIRSYDLGTEANVGTSFIRHLSRLALHPSQTRVYAANTDVSPSDIERFDLDPVTGALTARGNSPYHGDHPMAGNVFAHPNGQFLITRGGGGYNTTTPFATDMTHVLDLAGGAESLSFSPDASTFVRSHLSNPTLLLHDASDFHQIRSIAVGTGPVEFVRHEGTRLLAVTLDDERSLFTEVRLVLGVRP